MKEFIKSLFKLSRVYDPLLLAYNGTGILDLRSDTSHDRASMNRIFVSLIILFIGVGAILLVQATQTSASTVYLPSELAKKDSKTVISRVRVAGKVVAEKMNYQLEPEIRLEFSIEDPEKEASGVVPVVYEKLMPDMFAAGRSVIIDGEYREGTLYAHNLLTQCPSKYEPPTPLDQMEDNGKEKYSK